LRDAISAVVITRDEEDEIDACLASLAWADEIVVVDSGSTDRTVAIARRRAHKVRTLHFRGFTAQKRAATELAAGPWILSVDADERVTDELREEILAAIDGGVPVGYRIPRLTWCLGAFVRHGMWYPDYKLRLFRKETGRWEGGKVHERVAVGGPVGTLQSPILHYSFRTIADHHATIDHFTRLGAEDLTAAGQGGSPWNLLIHPPATFLKSYVLRLGFLDGWRGLLIALLSAKHSFRKYARARRILRSRRGGASG